MTDNAEVPQVQTNGADATGANLASAPSSSSLPMFVASAELGAVSIIQDWHDNIISNAYVIVYLSRVEVVTRHNQFSMCLTHESLNIFLTLKLADHRRPQIKIILTWMIYFVTATLVIFQRAIYLVTKLQVNQLHLHLPPLPQFP